MKPMTALTNNPFIVTVSVDIFHFDPISYPVQRVFMVQ